MTMTYPLTSSQGTLSQRERDGVRKKTNSYKKGPS
jgi:hypothetical protein